MARNGYFRLDMRPDGVYLSIIPEEDGGKTVSIKEVTEYLQSNKLTGYDLKTLNAATMDKSGSAEVRVSDPVSFFVNETMALELSADQMKLYARFYPNSEGGTRLKLESILNDLHYKKVRYGIQEDVIKQFLTERAYCTDYMIAIGTPPRAGKDASIEYFFKTKVDMKPKTNEDGSVDFHDLDIVSAVEKGQLLARLTPADPGDMGTDVFGNKVNPPKVNVLKLQYGKNISISEDLTEIYSEVTGHAMLTGDRVFVSDVYEVAADVDNSTGDIDYPGSVHVQGNVKSGFSVKATGDVVIDGVVEGATVVAGGQIVVRQGIHGMGKGVLSAESNVLCKFIENAAVKSASGYVTSDTIIHSNVEAHTEVRVSGRKGNITGGSVRAGQLIEANYLGTEMGANTELEVGSDPVALKKHAELVKEEKHLAEEIEKIKPILASFTKQLQSGIQLEGKKKLYVTTLATQLKTLQKRYQEVAEELRALQAYVTQTGRSKIIVHRTAYPGVTIKIGNASTTLKSKRDYCCYMSDGADVRTEVL